MGDFEEVYNLYFKDVYRYVLSISRNPALAEEITQETFYKAIRGLKHFDGRCKVYVWLCQIAKNCYLSHLRREKRLDRSAPADAGKDDGIEGRLLEREAALEVHRVLHRLSEPYKEVFSLRTFGELSFAQIAELFGKTESWARVTYHRAKLKIREELE